MVLTLFSENLVFTFFLVFSFAINANTAPLTILDGLINQLNLVDTGLLTTVVDNFGTVSISPNIQPKLEFAKYGVQGAFAGGCRALSRGLTYPFDTMKTLEQTKLQSFETKSKVKKNKINYLKGLIPTVISAVPSNALFFIVYSSLKVLYNYYNDLDLGLDLSVDLVISTIATLPQNLVKIPSEVIKQRAQVVQCTTTTSMKDQSIFAVIKSIYEEDGGIRGFYEGGNAQLFREIPYNALQMTFYDVLKDMTKTIQLSSPQLESALLGLFAASFAAVITQPADVIKTKLMTRNAVGDSDFEATLGDKGRIKKENFSKLVEGIFINNSVYIIMSSILEKEGVKGLFVGLKPRLYIVSFGGLVYFYCLQLVSDFYNS